LVGRAAATKAGETFERRRLTNRLLDRHVKARVPTGVLRDLVI
jgi:hypothetical protein